MKTKVQVFGLWLFSFMTLFAMTPAPANAACEEANQNRPIFGIPSWDVYLQHDPDLGNAVCNFDFPQDLFLVLLALIDMLMRFAAYLAVGLVIYSGFKFMTARGSPDRIAEAKKVLEESILGLLITVLSVSIISFVAGRFL